MDLGKYVTEQRNPNSMNLHQMSTYEILKIMNEEDKKVAYVVQTLIPEIELVVDATVERIKRGGRLIYVGAGSSGRLGMMDSSECPPTFMTPPELVQTVMAGGNEAYFSSVENAEDNLQQGKLDLQARNITPNDVVIGITASGRTPYPIGAVQYANSVGALTVGLTCNSESEINAFTDYAIEAVVGPEVLTGSTRLKSGTAHKLILNMISTSTMVKLGKVYENLMVDVHASNEKLIHRATNIVKQITDSTYDEARTALENHDYHVKAAILSLKTGATKETIDVALLAENGYLEQAKNRLLNT